MLCLVLLSLRSISDDLVGLLNFPTSPRTMSVRAFCEGWRCRLLSKCQPLSFYDFGGEHV